MYPAAQQSDKFRIIQQYCDMTVCVVYFAFWLAFDLAGLSMSVRELIVRRSGIWARTLISWQKLKKKHIGSLVFLKKVE